MDFVQKFWRGGRVTFFTLVGWLVVYGTAFAAQPLPVKKDPNESVGSGVYVMAYFLVIFAVAGGMLFVCRASNRRDRARPDQQAESKSVKPE